MYTPPSHTSSSSSSTWWDSVPSKETLWSLSTDLISWLSGDDSKTSGSDGLHRYHYRPKQEFSESILLPRKDAIPSWSEMIADYVPPSLAGTSPTQEHQLAMERNLDLTTRRLYDSRQREQEKKDRLYSLQNYCVRTVTDASKLRVEALHIDNAAISRLNDLRIQFALRHPPAVLGQEAETKQDDAWQVLVDSINKELKELEQQASAGTQDSQAKTASSSSAKKVEPLIDAAEKIERRLADITQLFAQVVKTRERIQTTLLAKLSAEDSIESRPQPSREELASTLELHHANLEKLAPALRRANQINELRELYAAELVEIADSVISPPKDRSEIDRPALRVTISTSDRSRNLFRGAGSSYFLESHICNTQASEAHTLAGKVLKLQADADKDYREEIALRKKLEAQQRQLSEWNSELKEELKKEAPPKITPLPAPPSHNPSYIPSSTSLAAHTVHHDYSPPQGERRQIQQNVVHYPQLQTHSPTDPKMAPIPLQAIPSSLATPYPPPTLQHASAPAELGDMTPTLQ